MFWKPAFLIVLLVTFIPLVEANEPSAPVAVAALDVGGDYALVAWVPGGAPADEYRIYGISTGGARTWLTTFAPADTSPTVLLVDGGFATYAVTGVLHGQESDMVYAAHSACVTLDDNPPGAWVGVSCIVNTVLRTKSIWRS